MQTNFTTKEVFSAYKKLKHYFYYDNTSLFIRKRIADFENDIHLNLNGIEYVNAFWHKMNFITDLLNKKDLNFWREYFATSINYRLTPKAFEKPRLSILTNRAKEENLELKRINITIDADIVVHIISVLWLTNVGRYLSDWIDKDNYAYLLELNANDDEKKVVNGLRLYKPYFIQYQNWRDNAIKKAEQLFEEKKDSVILSLDIKDYFHSVVINLKSIETELYNEKGFLNNDPNVHHLFNLLHEVNLCYSNKIVKVKELPSLQENETVLPIGLLSSGLLGNIYLRQFDKDAKEALNPIYYGRYVDDILFVLTNVTVSQNTLSPVNNFLEKYFIKRNLLLFKEIPASLQKNKTEFSYYEPDVSKLNNAEYLHYELESQTVKFRLKGFETLEIQSKKVILQDLDGKQSPAIINNFKKNLEKNRSEFRYLPDEDEVDKEFDQEAFSLHYTDSLNKLRSIKEFSEDKYGASKYLAGKIFTASFTNEKPDEKTTNQILTFFSGLIGLSFFTLWEKVATYFIINNQSYQLSKFFSETVKSISNITFGKLDEIGFEHEVRSQLEFDLLEYLKISVSTPLAYNPQSLDKRYFNLEIYDSMIEYAKSIRYSNLHRHSWVWLPSINFTNYLFLNNGNNNLLRFSGSNGSSKKKGAIKKQLVKEDVSFDEEEFRVEKRLQLLSPRYVHFHEFNLLEIFKFVSSVSKETIESFERIEKISDNSFDEYWKLNQCWKYEATPDQVSTMIEDAKKEYFTISTIGSDGENSSYNSGSIINIANSEHKNAINKKVALANIKVEPDNIKNSYLGSANTSRNRRQELFKLINSVEKAKCNLFVLPEVSVPYQWLGLLAYQSCKRNLAIIAGLEHWVNQFGFVFNFMTTILPIKKKNYTTCLIKIRLKNHYSHEERKQLKGYRLLIPDEVLPKKLKKYDLFHWEKVYFSVYNCFELADIFDRALFKSKVDFIVASEYNRDTNYFSEIAGSWVRDIHCFFIQVNSSDYGDSRIVQPSTTATRDILRIKGGENSIVIIGTLPIKELRNFQLKEYDLQKDDSTFKSTPPDFDRANVEIRIGNTDIK